MPHPSTLIGQINADGVVLSVSTTLTFFMSALPGAGSRPRIAVRSRPPMRGILNVTPCADTAASAYGRHS